MQKRQTLSFIVSVLAAYLLFGTGITEARACSTCLIAAADRLLPPIGLWCFIAAFWFLATALLSSFHRARIHRVPGLATAFAVVALCALLSAGFVGPVAFLPLGLTANVAFTRSFRTDRPESCSPTLHTAINRLGFAMLLLVSGASLISFQILHERTPADFAAQWHRGHAASYLSERSGSRTP